MGNTRICTRCNAGTETCVIGNYYDCDQCDQSREEIKAKPQYKFVIKLDKSLDPDQIKINGGVVLKPGQFRIYTKP